MDLNECPCSGKSLSRLVRPAVMAVLTEGPVHGYRIVRRLGELSMFADHAPDPTGIYRLLRSMEEDGLVTSSWELADSGPAKRRFELTGGGRECLAQWVRTLATYKQAVADLLELTRSAAAEAR